MITCQSLSPNKNRELKSLTPSVSIEETEILIISKRWGLFQDDGCVFIIYRLPFFAASLALGLIFSEGINFEHRKKLYNTCLYRQNSLPIQVPKSLNY